VIDACSCLLPAGLCHSHLALPACLLPSCLQLVQLVAKGVVDGVRAAYDSLSSFL
jgi:hypothetical protein